MSEPADVLLERDCAAFLAEVRDVVGERRRDEYARVLFALTAWSLSRERLIFCPKEPASDAPQATISFYLRGGPLFWEIYPRKTRKDAKFSCLSSVDARVPAALKADLLRQFADLSPGKAADSPTVP